MKRDELFRDIMLIKAEVLYGGIIRRSYGTNQD